MVGQGTGEVTADMQGLLWPRGCAALEMACVVLVLASVWSLAAGPSGPGPDPSGSGRGGLPEGCGLSARHPGDAGIARDPAVLFAEDFEESSLEQVDKHWGGETSNKDGKVLSLSSEVPPQSPGKQSLQMTGTLGENSGGHLYTVFPGVDKAFVRFYVKFAADHGYEHHFVELGGYNPPTPYPNPRAGTRPQGDDRVMVFIDPIGEYGQYPPPGIWMLYTYWPEMKISADNMYWGNCMNPIHPQPVPRGQWQCVELMIKLNTPGKADGELALWLDGKLVMHVVKGIPRGPWSGMGFDLLAKGGEPFEGLRLRTSAELNINHLWLEHYVDEFAQRQSNLDNPNPVNRVWFDDVVVSTQYIGPIWGVGKGR